MAGLPFTSFKRYVGAEYTKLPRDSRFLRKSLLNLPFLCRSNISDVRSRRIMRGMSLIKRILRRLQTSAPYKKRDSDTFWNSL